MKLYILEYDRRDIARKFVWAIVALAFVAMFSFIMGVMG